MQAASNAAVAAAQQISPPNQSPSKPTIKAADPEKFSGDRAETEGFIRDLNLSITIQPGSFPDARMKMLYALSFMSGGYVHIWAQSETDAVIKGTSSFKTFEDFTKKVEEMFGNPDSARTACTKLHNLRMTSGMSAGEYMTQFEVLTARTSFNDPALEDAYSCGLTVMILDKIHAQPSLPKDLKA